MASAKSRISVLENDNARLSNDSSVQEEKSQSRLKELQAALEKSDGKLADVIEELRVTQSHYDEQCRVNDETKTNLSETKLVLSETERNLANRLDNRLLKFWIGKFDFGCVMRYIFEINTVKCLTATY